MITLGSTVAIELLRYLNEEVFDTGPIIRFYNGVRPPYPNNVIGAATLLAEVRFQGLAFGGASSDGGGAVFIELADLPPPGEVINTGVATFFRAYGIAAGVEGTGQPVIDGDVSNMDGTGDCKLLDTSLIAGQQVNILDWKIYLPQ